MAGRERPPRELLAVAWRALVAMVTFPVDEVEPVTTPLPRAPYDLEAALGARVLARSPGLEEVVAPGGGVNGLALAVHKAFAEHRPLALSPDAVWLAIAQGFALHVREHDAELRTRLVRHLGKHTLIVEVPTFGGLDWPAVAERYARGLEGAVANPGLVRALTEPFSTTGPTEHTAHCAAAMDAFSRYVDYELKCICGIPSVTLLGTPGDWRAVQARFRVLAEHDLQWWAERLDPVLEKLVETADGHPDVDFWRSIYKPKRAYGGEVATGWLVRLFPYLQGAGGEVRRSGLRPGEGAWLDGPVAPGAFPGGLSRVVLRLTSVGGFEPRLATLCAGFLGVRQEASGALAPRLGWAVLAEPAAAMWDELSRRHRLPPPRADRPPGLARELPPLLLEFYDRFDGGPLHGGELVLAPAPGPSEGWGELLVDLDGSQGLHPLRRAVRLGHLRDGTEVLWYRVDGHATPERVFLRPPEGAPPYLVVATSLLELYQRLASVSSFPPWEVKGRWTPVFR